VAELLKPFSALKNVCTTVDKYTSIVFMVYRIYGIVLNSGIGYDDMAGIV